MPDSVPLEASVRFTGITGAVDSPLKPSPGSPPWKPPWKPQTSLEEPLMPPKSTYGTGILGVPWEAPLEAPLWPLWASCRLGGDPVAALVKCAS